MGVHTDSIYKDSQREVEAVKVDTEQLLSTEVPDDEKFYFGTDEDVSLRWDEAAGYFEIFSEPDSARSVRITPGGRLDLASPGAASIDVTGNFNLRGYSIVNVGRLQIDDDSQLQFGDDADITLEYDSANARLLASGTDFVDETADGMTADPEADTEDGFLKIRIGTTNYQIPIYGA